MILSSFFFNRHIPQNLSDSKVLLHIYHLITNDLDRREAEHRNEGMQFTSINKVGNITTRDAAEAWEADRIATYKENHHGDRPLYNQNDSGK